MEEIIRKEMFSVNKVLTRRNLRGKRDDVENVLWKRDSKIWLTGRYNGFYKFYRKVNGVSTTTKKHKVKRTELCGVGERYEGFEEGYKYWSNEDFEKL